MHGICIYMSSVLPAMSWQKVIDPRQGKTEENEVFGANITFPAIGSVKDIR